MNQQNNEIKQTALAEISKLCQETGVSLDDDRKDSLATLCLRLFDYNQKVNLVADASPALVAKRHVMDSLSLLDLLDKFRAPKPAKRKQRLIDIGTGAGFPGLVLAIAEPHLEVVLLDSVKKKLVYVQSVIDELCPGDRVSVRAGRAEDASDLRASFDYATTRAVGHLRLLSELALPLLKVGGVLLCQKTLKQTEKELPESEDLITRLGGAKPRIVTPDIQTGETTHVVVAIEKGRETPEVFPRLWAEMKRETDSLISAAPQS